MAEANGGDDAVLEVHDISVRFGGLKALEGVTIDVAAGRVTGLIGPNGAGKTTLFNVICGLESPGSGKVLIAGRDVTFAQPHRRARLGVGRTFQRLETFGTLSVRDNVLVAAEMRRGWSRERFRPGELADELIDRVGLGDVASVRVDRLPTGTARLVEVARALASKPKVLLLDEPSSGLNESETAALGELLRELGGSDLGVLLVEHDMAFVMGTCDHIHVLDFGQIIATGSPDEIQSNPTVRAAYLGEEKNGELPEEQAALLHAIARDREAEGNKDSPKLGDGKLAEGVRDEATAPVSVPPSAAPRAGTAEGSTSQEGAGGAALELAGVRASYGTIAVLHGVDLVVPPGTVFALLGPNGAGKSTTLKVVCGQLRPTDGTVTIDGRDVTGRSADRLAREGVCLVPEGRGIFPNLTVTENLRMATYTGSPFRATLERAFTRFPRLKERRKQVAGTLSGGEQQMLSIARALAIDPKVLLLDELSMGLAPLIVEELYETVKQVAKGDVSIVVVEQFAHEVLGIADTAAIMLNGRIEMTGPPTEVNEELERAYLGGAVGDGS